MAVGLEEQRVFLDEAGDLAAPGEAELPVELASVVEAKDMFGLLGEEVLGLCNESKEGVALDDVLEVRNAIGLRLNQLGAGTYFLCAFFLEFFGGFGDQEGGGEWRGEKLLQGVRVKEWAYRRLRRYG